MNFNMAGVQGRLLGNFVREGHGFKDLLPNASFAPARKAIVDRLVGTIFLRAVPPATADFQNVHDPTQDAMIILAFRTRLMGWQVRYNFFPLLVTEPK